MWAPPPGGAGRRRYWAAAGTRGGRRGWRARRAQGFLPRGGGGLKAVGWRAAGPQPRPPQVPALPRGNQWRRTKRPTSKTADSVSPRGRFPKGGSVVRRTAGRGGHRSGPAAAPPRAPRALGHRHAPRATAEASGWASHPDRLRPDERNVMAVRPWHAPRSCRFARERKRGGKHRVLRDPRKRSCSFGDLWVARTHHGLKFDGNGLG